MGFSWDKIGIIFTVMLLPFLFLEYPLGRLSDKVGEKKMLRIGLLIMAFATLSIPFISEPKILPFAIALFLSRVGAATIEIMTESYFFKSVTEEHADEISFYRNTSPVSFIIGPLLAIPVLFLTPSFEYIYFVLGAIILIGYYLAHKLRDVR
jgi:MFS family permease